MRPGCGLAVLVFLLACALVPAVRYAALACAVLLLVLACAYAVRKHRPRALRAPAPPAQVRVRAAFEPPVARAVHDDDPPADTCVCGNRATTLYDGVPACEGCAGDDHTPVPAEPDPDAGPGVRDMTEFEEKL